MTSVCFPIARIGTAILMDQHRFCRRQLIALDTGLRMLAKLSCTVFLHLLDYPSRFPFPVSLLHLSFRLLVTHSAAFQTDHQLSQSCLPTLSQIFTLMKHFPFPYCSILTILCLVLCLSLIVLSFFFFSISLSQPTYCQSLHIRRHCF